MNPRSNSVEFFHIANPLITLQISVDTKVFRTCNKLYRLEIFFPRNKYRVEYLGETGEPGIGYF